MNPLNILLTFVESLSVISLKLNYYGELILNMSQNSETFIHLLVLSGHQSKNPKIISLLLN